MKREKRVRANQDPADFEVLMGDLIGLEANKSLRAIHAILRTGYDNPTKMVLIVYAMDMNVKRKDFAAWRSLLSLGALASLGRDTIMKIQEQCVKDGVLHQWSKHHHLQKRNKAGRYSKCFSLVISKLESLAKQFTVEEIRASRGQHQAATRRVRSLKRKADAARQEVEEVIDNGTAEQPAPEWYAENKTVRDMKESSAEYAETKATEAEGQLNSTLAGARLRLTLLKREADQSPEAAQRLRAHIKVLNRMEREAKERTA